MESPLESVTVEMKATAGRAAFNIVAVNIQAEQAVIWERIIQILQGGLRAATLQAVPEKQEPPRLVEPCGFLLPPSGGH